MISRSLIAPYFRGSSKTRQSNCQVSENPVGAYSLSTFLTTLKLKFRQNILEGLVEEGAVILLDQRIAYQNLLSGRNVGRQF